MNGPAFYQTRRQYHTRGTRVTSQWHRVGQACACEGIGRPALNHGCDGLRNVAVCDKPLQSSNGGKKVQGMRLNKKL
jgi:hypothetical protein